MAKNSYIDKLAKEIEFYITRDGEVGYESLSRLGDLESYMEKENIPSSELINYPSLISLYHLRDDESLKAFDSRTNFFESIRLLRQEIRDCKTNLTDLQAEQISAFVKHDALEEDKQVFSDYVLREVVLGNHRFSYDTLRQALINVVDGVLDTFDQGKYCEVVKDLRNKRGEVLVGQKTATGVKINEESVKRLYEVGDCDVIETAFHESFHIYQEARLRKLNKLFYPENVEEMVKVCRGDFFAVIDMLKDYVLQDVAGVDYYYDNYDVSSSEKEANIRAKTAVMGYFDALGILTPYMKDGISEEIDDELFKQQDRLRIFKEKRASIDDLVLENQTSLKRMMISYPILRMIYTKDEDGKYREKTKDELLLDYSDLEHNDQVNSVYRELIKRAESKNKLKSSEPNR